MYTFPKHKIITVFKSPGDSIKVEFPTNNPNRTPSQFEIYLYSCLQGRIYQKFDSNGSDIIQISSCIKQNKSDSTFDGVSRKEQVLLGSLLKFSENQELTSLADRIVEQKNESADKIWLDVNMVSNYLSAPVANIYRVNGIKYETMLSSYKDICTSLNQVIDPDPRQCGYEEMFSFGFLNAIYLDAPYLFKRNFYKKIIRSNRDENKKGITFTYIDHKENAF